MKSRISLSKGFFPLLFSSLIIILCLAGCAEDNHILDKGGNKELEFSVKTYSWNNSNSSSDSKPDSRATPIIGNTFDTSKSFNVIADVNHGGNWSTEVNNETAAYSTANKIWQTTATHYWPGSGSTVNFYAYYPTSISSNITHTAGSAPILSYTVPDNTADQTDILASSKIGVAGDSYNQTPVDFKHIFAAIQFSIGSSGLPNGTITKIILNNIQYKGTYSLDGTWIPNTTDKKSFSQIVSVPTSAGTAITWGTTTFMMMPQILGSDASITVMYSNGGTLTKVITGTWEAGKTYTYNLSKTIPVANFDYTGNVQYYTVPLTGTYKLDVWGAQGGPNPNISSIGGKGGFAQGYIQLIKNYVLYIFVGGQGYWALGTGGGGGYNGGGNAGIQGGSGGGGGATHIAIANMGELKNYALNQNEILIVAGGGGGGDGNILGGGYGGGISGGNVTGGDGGTQSSGYAFGLGQSMGSSDGSGGGGGWYGGYGTTFDGAGGGSGYIAPAIVGSTIAGNQSIPSPSGGTETGHAGNGYARITFVSAN